MQTAQKIHPGDGQRRRQTAGQRRSGTSIPTVTPISADSTLPPTIDHGCASGLLGTPNRSTAEAPIGAINHRLTSPSSQWLNMLVTASPVPAPMDPSTICRRATGSACGFRRPRKIRSRENSPAGITLNIALSLTS
jgi:hypothetical protein